MPRSADVRCFLSEGDPPSKQAILRSALRMFVRHGLAGTSVRMIADEAGYTNPALFKFFESKDALALYLFERCYLRLFRALEPGIAGRPFAEGVSGALEAYVDVVDEDLEAVLFVQDTLRELWPRLPAAARRRSILGLVRGLFERGMREGAVTGYRTPDVPVAAFVGLMGQLARMAYFGELERPARRWRDELERAVLRLSRG